MKTTSVFNRNVDAYNSGFRYIVNKGSTRSSKTYSVLQLLILIARLSAKPRIISVVSESIPHLKKGCIRDFKEILMNENLWDENDWNATDRIYKINNSMIEFFSADNPSKVHGPSRSILYVNECININYETIRQLAIRTTETIFLDYNPCHEFWVDEKILPSERSILIHSTYKDNEYLTREQIEEIESNSTDVEWFKVYGLGETGSKIGLVIQDYEIVLSMPEHYKSRWLGLDFGFTNDPTAIVDVRLSEGELWINELLFDTGYDNIMISEHLKVLNIPNSLEIVADSAEPKSISEIKAQRWKVEPAIKGPDSVNVGLSIINRYKKHVTNTSLNILREFRNYRWIVDEFGKPTNKPIDKFNHSIDSIRYVALNKLSEKRASNAPRARTVTF